MTMRGKLGGLCLEVELEVELDASLVGIILRRESFCMTRTEIGMRPARLGTQSHSDYPENGATFAG
jgi:hypothetical protein